MPFLVNMIEKHGGEFETIRKRAREEFYALLGSSTPYGTLEKELDVVGDSGTLHIHYMNPIRFSIYGVYGIKTCFRPRANLQDYKWQQTVDFVLLC